MGSPSGLSIKIDCARLTDGARENWRLASVKNLTFKEVLDLVRPDLLRVEEEFGVQTAADVRPIAEIGQYLQEGGGKGCVRRWCCWRRSCAVTKGWRPSAWAQWWK